MRGNRMEKVRSTRFARDDVSYRWIRVHIDRNEKEYPQNTPFPGNSIFFAPRQF